MNAFRLKRLGAGSDKYGACEVCERSSDTSYLLTTYKAYSRKQDKSDHYSHLKTTFGCKGCLSNETRLSSEG